MKMDRDAIHSYHYVYGTRDERRVTDNF